MLTKISTLTEKEQDALFSLWEYVANQSEEVVSLYLNDLRLAAKALEVSDRKFMQETGHEPMDMDDYYKKIYGDDF